MKTEFPEVETAVRFRYYGSSLVKRDNQNYSESDIIYCDSTLFDVFSIGASTMNLLVLLSKDFLKLVLIALVIAIPLAWYLMDNWLKDFAYATSLEWWIFAVAGLLAILIAFLTVSFQSVKAALANPINSLRSE